MIADAPLERVLARRTVALLGDLIRAALWGAVIVVWVVFAQIYARMYRLTLEDPSHSDFTIFYFTARLVADGLPMYGASPARYGIEWAGDHLGNLNPPHFQLLVQPLAALAYGSSASDNVERIAGELDVGLDRPAIQRDLHVIVLGGRGGPEAPRPILRTGRPGPQEQSGRTR